MGFDEYLQRVDEVIKKYSDSAITSAGAEISGHFLALNVLGHSLSHTVMSVHSRLPLVQRTTPTHMMPQTTKTTMFQQRRRNGLRLWPKVNNKATSVLHRYLVTVHSAYISSVWTPRCRLRGIEGGAGDFSISLNCCFKASLIIHAVFQIIQIFVCRKKNNLSVLLFSPFICVLTTQTRSVGTLCRVQQSDFSPALMLIGCIYICIFLISDRYLNLAPSVIQV